jgi:hypothetical protein
MSKETSLRYSTFLVPCSLFFTAPRSEHLVYSAAEHGEFFFYKSGNCFNGFLRLLWRKSRLAYEAFY